MKDKKISIKINKSAHDIFSFALNPKNTPFWIDNIVIEEVSEWPVRVGSIYRNKNKKGEWSEYILTTLKENETFEMSSRDKNYHVRYTLKPIDSGSTELEYYEWVNIGNLENPFTPGILQKLKVVLEAQEN